MIWTVLAVQAVSLGATNYAVNLPMAPPAAPPAFADEFDGSAIDKAKWRFDTTRNAAGWYNGELQYYAADRADNARVEDGALVIQARKGALSRDRFTDWGGQAYSSAKLVTRTTLGHGFYQIRAKLPCGRGMWPAIWLLPSSGQWPAAGEIDIMEMIGSEPNLIHATLHSAAYNHAKGTQRGAQAKVPTACTAFHDYQLDWQPNTITIGVDGRAFMRVTKAAGDGAPEWPFTRPYQLILNLAVGGNWAGKDGIDDAALPQTITVDHVRHWPARD